MNHFDSVQNVPPGNYEQCINIPVDIRWNFVRVSIFTSRIELSLNTIEPKK